VSALVALDPSRVALGSAGAAIVSVIAARRQGAAEQDRFLIDDNGRTVPADPAVAEAARLALVQEWRTEQAGGPDVVAADTERARSRGDLTEAQVMIAEADRLDRSNDAKITTTSDTTRDSRNLSGIADELDRRAGEYERDADSGGTPR
jgi:hypothetical protein